MLCLNLLPKLVANWTSVIFLPESISSTHSIFIAGIESLTFITSFGKGSSYDLDHKNTPISGGWRTHSLTTFCQNYDEGKQLGDPADEQSDCT